MLTQNVMMPVPALDLARAQADKANFAVAYDAKQFGVSKVLGLALDLTHKRIERVGIEEAFTLKQLRVLFVLSWKPGVERVSFKLGGFVVDWICLLRERVEKRTGELNSRFRKHIGNGVYAWWILEILGPLEEWGLEPGQLEEWYRTQHKRGLAAAEQLRWTAQKPLEKRAWRQAKKRHQWSEYET